MAASGYTPIQLYYSTTTTNTPLAANLAAGELAINTADGKLFYKDSGGSVQVIGWKTTPASAGGTGLTSPGTAGYVLTSTGTGWASQAINGLPSQTGNSGKYLTTDGSNASWATVGASAGGVIYENSLVISSNYTLSSGKNGFSVGPITVSSGASVTVPSGQRWVIL